MTNLVKLSAVTKPREKLVDEPDRYPLRADIRFVITDFVLVDSKKYGPASIAKINGYDLITRQSLKYRTTSKRVISQLIEMSEIAGTDDVGRLKSHVKVLVGAYRTGNGPGLELRDAD